MKLVGELGLKTCNDRFSSRRQGVEPLECEYPPWHKIAYLDYEGSRTFILDVSETKHIFLIITKSNFEVTNMMGVNNNHINKGKPKAKSPRKPVIKKADFLAEDSCSYTAPKLYKKVKLELC